jgi:hypothetical protein
MPKAKVNRKNLRIVESKKPPAPNRPEVPPSVNGSSQHSQPTNPNVAEFATTMLFWPLRVMKWWMPASISAHRRVTAFVPRAGGTS